ncbi:substrate-binding domain-containing protein [Pedobacter sp. AW31-3R]|uniref:substrate-binding domain-containing protein n=1 Tax=Pedobacter sp. AW31-3R TaxID=3445781 RepID=UPI003FA02A93
MQKLIKDFPRRTVEIARKELAKAGMVIAKPRVNVLLLMNGFSGHTKVLFDAFIKALDNRALVDLYIYNNDFPAFRKRLLEKHGAYDKVVIVLHFNVGNKCPLKLLRKVSGDKLVLLDKQLSGMEGAVSSVYADVKSDIFEAMEKLYDRLVHYGLLILVPGSNHFAKEIVEGFRGFCDRYGFAGKVIDYPEQCPIGFGQAYIFLQEEDLVSVIERVQAVGLTVGKDVGLVSYGESPLKRVILDGITTVSSDVEMMGSLAAACVLDNEVRNVAVPFEVNIRNSL